MPDLQSESWLTITDFRGGIRQLTNSTKVDNFSPQPPGIASAVDASKTPVTYDCIALPGGGLGPLPFQFKAEPIAAFNPDAPANIGGGTIKVVGLHVPQNRILDPLSGGGGGTDYAYVFVVITYIYTPPAPDTHRYRLYRWSAGDQTFSQITNATVPGPLEEVNIPAGVITFGFADMADYRYNHANPLVPGNPRLAIGICDSVTDYTNIQRYPTDPILFPNQADNWLAIKRCVRLISHQGRLVVNGAQNGYQYDSNNVFIHNDDFFWTSPNDSTYDNGGAVSSFAQTNVGFWGDIFSSSASEMVAISAAANGGITISSDLNSPIVTSYPTMQGTNGCYIRGCWTPLGYVYAALNGSVYAYKGGGQSLDLAPSMEAGFWHELSESGIGQGFLETGFAAGVQNLNRYMGKLAYQSGYIFLPNNWLFDCDTQSWWRFRTPTDNQGPSIQGNFHSNQFDVSPGGTVYATNGDWSNGPAGNAPFLNAAHFQDSAATSWRWTSQPIPITQESEWNGVYEFIIEGLAHSAPVGAPHTTLDVGLTSYPNGQTELFSLTFTQSDAPQIFRRLITNQNLRGTHIVVNLGGVDSTDTTTKATSAPLVFRFDLGLTRDTRVF